MLPTTETNAPARPASSHTANIVRIWDLFDEWRQLGNKRLANGTELIGAQDEEQTAWLHVLYCGLSSATIDRIAHELGAVLPKDLRAFYRRCNGMHLFGGAFRLFGWRERTVSEGDGALQPDDIVFANHELDALGWKPNGAIAFAQNAWDMSVHLIGMPDDPNGVVRCDRATGTVLERHENLFACIWNRLFRLDQLQLE